MSSVPLAGPETESSYKDKAGACLVFRSQRVSACERFTWCDVWLKWHSWCFMYYSTIIYFTGLATQSIFYRMHQPLKTNLQTGSHIIEYHTCVSMNFPHEIS